MCGICGFWRAAPDTPADPHVLRAMTETLVHRGPDDGAVFTDGAVGLGQRRLVVVDPDGGRQPMPNEDGRVHAVFNGEIYNHEDLRRELIRRGHTFRSRSDTEAVVHAFEEWGERCVERFNGMFALAVWDARRGTLFLARDRLGIKPLYVHRGGEGVTFGSELKAVVTAPWVPVSWDLEAVDDFITCEYVPAPRSVVAGVEKLRPARTLTVREGGRSVSERTYWALEAAAGVRTGADAREALRSTLATSVERRLMADRPVGAFLSGGIDSSILVALMARLGPAAVATFSLGFRDRSYDELAYARQVAAAYGARHEEERVTPEVVDLAGTLTAAFDEPFGDVSAFPTYLISRMARRHVTVALSGDGGDELFAGYDHYRAHRWAHRLRWLTVGWPWQAVDRLLARLPPTQEKKGPVNVAKRFAQGLRLPGDLEHARWWVFSDLAERRALYRGPLAAAAEARDPFGHYRHRMAEARGAGFQGLQRQLHADLAGYLPDDILVKVDRMSMAASLEARVPFLDHEVVELAMTIPASEKLSRGTSKRVLRDAFRDTLPRTIRGRGKEGFSIPMKNWLRGPLRERMETLLGDDGLRRRDWFQPEEVRRLADEHLAGAENHAHRLWCLMALELSLSHLEEQVRRRPSGERAPGAPAPDASTVER